LEVAVSEATAPKIQDEPIDLQPVYDILEKHAGEKGMLIPVLQEVQDAYGFVPEEAANAVAEGMGIYKSQVYGVLTFYTQFHLSPRGKHIIRACAGTACHVKGGKQVILRMENELGVGHGGTTEDLIFSFEEVACIGACGLAPVIMIDEKAYGNLDPNKAEKVLKQFRKQALAAMEGESGEDKNSDGGEDASGE
jgi:NADH-quinone oxidoreductase subunit E